MDADTTLAVRTVEINHEPYPFRKSGALTGPPDRQALTAFVPATTRQYSRLKGVGFGPGTIEQPGYSRQVRFADQGRKRTKPAPNLAV